MKIGDKIPEVFGLDANGKEITSAQYAGQPIIIFFYPKDNTSGCTAEACSLRDYYKELQEMGYALIGVSKDSAASHQKFAEKHSLPFTLIADVDKTLNQAFGVWQLKKMCGRESMGTVRTTFITNASHEIIHIINKVDTKNAGQQIVDLLTDSK